MTNTLIQSRIVNHMSKVISEMENIPHEKLKVSIWFNYIFITDGERIFRLILNKSLAKNILKTRMKHYKIFEIEDYLFDEHYNSMLEKALYNGLSDMEAQDSVFSDLCNVSYREVKSTAVKIYVDEDLAAAMMNDGITLYQTLNGSRNAFNRYVIIGNGNIIQDAVDIYDFQYPEHIQYMFKNNMKILIDMKESGVDIRDKDRVRAYLKETLEKLEKEAAIMDFVIKCVENVA